MMHFITVRTPYELKAPVGPLHEKLKAAFTLALRDQHVMREEQRAAKQAALAAAKRPGMPSAEHPRFRKARAVGA